MQSPPSHASVGLVPWLVPVTPKGGKQVVTLGLQESIDRRGQVFKGRPPLYSGGCLGMPEGNFQVDCGIAHFRLVLGPGPVSDLTTTEAGFIEVTIPNRINDGHGIQEQERVVHRLGLLRARFRSPCSATRE